MANTKRICKAYVMNDYKGVPLKQEGRLLLTWEMSLFDAVKPIRLGKIPGRLYALLNYG
jgi:hypothetical protein